jgi:hypothetical protein
VADTTAAEFWGEIMGWFLLAALVVLAVLTPRFGADSRDSRDWKASSPAEVRRDRL